MHVHECRVQHKTLKQAGTCHPLVDQYGLHVSTGCGKEGRRQQLHNALVLELNHLIRYAGGNTIREERDCFGAHLPDDHHRPDISILNPAGLDLEGKKVLIDVAVTCPLDGAQIGIIKKPTRTEARKSHSNNLNSTYKYKENKYRKLLEDCERAANSGRTVTLQQDNQPSEDTARDVFNPKDFVVYPIIFESTGAIHPESSKFIDSILEKAAESNRSHPDQLIGYFMKKLSVCLQTHLANTIHARVIGLMGNRDAQYGKLFPEEVIAEEK
jgi:hypothetical protein